jgi:Tol biopolymer transport system component
MKLSLLLGTVACAGISALAELPPVPWPKPYLIVEAWKDRQWVSDLYVYDLSGREIKRLTPPLLPTCRMIAMSADGADIAFEANAMCSYVLSLRYEALWPLHTSSTRCAAFSRNGKYVAYVGSSFLNFREQIIRVAGQRRQETQLCEDVADLLFTPGDKDLLATVWYGNRATVSLIDPASGRQESVLDDEGHSYFLQSVSPNDAQVLVISRDLQTEEDALVAVDWPSRRLHTLRTFPARRFIYSADYSADGKRVLSFADHILVMMDADGKNLVGLSGSAPTTENPVRAKGCGPEMKSRRGFLSVGRRYASYIRGGDSICVADIQRGEIHQIPLKGTQLRRVFVVD